MAISRAQLAKELEPGLNSLFGLEYDQYQQEYTEIFSIEDSQKAFEEEVLIMGFGSAPTKSEGQGVVFDNSSESYTARYTHDTIALAFALTEEAVEDNLYDSLGKRYTKALARSMANTKEVKGANVLNNAFSTSFTGGDGQPLIATAHPLAGGGCLRNLTEYVQSGQAPSSYPEQAKTSRPLLGSLLKCQTAFLTASSSSVAECSSKPRASSQPKLIATGQAFVI